MFDFNNVTSEISNDNDKLSTSYLLTQIVPVFKSLYGITLVLSGDKDSINSGIFDILNVDILQVIAMMIYQYMR